MHIREYQKEDLLGLKDLMDELQQNETAIDRLGIIHNPAGLSVVYTDNLINEIAKNQGKIFVAEKEERLIGCVAVVFEEWNEIDQMAHRLSRPGRIIELVVLADFRGQKIGEQLMKKAEEYLFGSGCDAIYVTVLSDNHKGQSFYQNIGYQNRTVDLIKLRD